MVQNGLAQSWYGTPPQHDRPGRAELQSLPCEGFVDAMESYPANFHRGADRISATWYIWGCILANLPNPQGVVVSLLRMDVFQKGLRQDAFSLHSPRAGAGPPYIGKPVTLNCSPVCGGGEQVRSPLNYGESRNNPGITHCNGPMGKSLHRAARSSLSPPEYGFLGSG